MTTIGILGYGEIGRAISTVLSVRKDLTIECWDKNVDILPNQKPLATIIPDCDVLFVCIPTWVIRSALQGVRDLLEPKTVIVMLSKGFEKETCTRIDALYQEIVGEKNPMVFLGGPMIAEELITGAQTRAVATSKVENARDRVESIFLKTSLTIETSEDFEGIVTAASLKNIYALGLGIGDGLNLGANAHGVLLSQAVKEMMAAVSAHGGQKESALGLAGLADLVATAQSPNSTNYTTGVRFSRGQSPLRGSEAMNTLPCVIKTMHASMNNLPFLHAIHEIVLMGANPKKTFDALISSK